MLSMWRVQWLWSASVVSLGLLAGRGESLDADSMANAAALKADQTTYPDYKIYHKKEDVLHRIGWIVDRNPSTFKAEDIKAGDRNYSTSMQVVTVDPAGIGSDSSKKVRLLMNFGEHGRELVTVEVALRLLEVLSDPSVIESWAERRHGNPQKILRLLEQCVFKIIPMENGHGRNLVEAGNLCERKNGRGVDSNRNWLVDWGKKEADYDPYEEFPGTGPFRQGIFHGAYDNSWSHKKIFDHKTLIQDDEAPRCHVCHFEVQRGMPCHEGEPEVQILDQLAKEFKPHVWLNVHSGMKALFMPYDHMASLPDDQIGKISYNLLDQINVLKCEGKCVVGSGGKSVGYLAHGTGTDYMHDVLGVPFSFTWEIYGDERASFQECFKMFNPLTQEALDQEVETWTDAILAMIELLPASSEGTSASNSLPRRLLPGNTVQPVAMLQDDLVYAHSPTDIAAGIRKTRMQEIFAQVDSINELLGLRPIAASSLIGFPTALLFGLLILVSILVYFVVRRYSRRLSLERGRAESSKL